MALNSIITSRRKDAEIPSMPTLEPKDKNEKDISKLPKTDTDRKTDVPQNVQQPSEPTTSPKLPPPNKRKTSILKDGIYSKLGDKNVNINEVTNITHHYDPLEKVLAEKKKLEQTVVNTKMKEDIRKAAGECR